MSWTCECTESNEFKVKNPTEVKSILEKMGFDVYTKDNSVQFYGDEGNYYNEDTSVVISTKPFDNEIEGEPTLIVGIEDDYHDDTVDEDTLSELGLTEDDVYRVPITEYLQCELKDGEYITITNAGYTGRGSGSCDPFGSVILITQNACEGGSLYSITEELITKHVKKEGV